MPYQLRGGNNAAISADGQFEQQVALELLRPGLDSDLLDFELATLLEPNATVAARTTRTAAVG